MSRSLYLYSQLQLKDLDTLVEGHKSAFDEMIGDTFSDEEMEPLEKLLDAIAAVTVQPIIADLSFDDFYPATGQEEQQQSYFKSCRSSICLENVPYYESNPFQVTYLFDLLAKLGEVLIDRGGVNELMFKDSFLQHLKKHKGMESIVPVVAEAPREIKTNKPVDPIDFLILDVYKEIQRLQQSGKLMLALEGLQQQSEKTKKIFFVMREERLEAGALFQKCGLGAKDFDDYLEKLKFFLKKITSS